MTNGKKTKKLSILQKTDDVARELVTSSDAFDALVLKDAEALIDLGSGVLQLAGVEDATAYQTLAREVRVAGTVLSLNQAMQKNSESANLSARLLGIVDATIKAGADVNDASQVEEESALALTLASGAFGLALRILQKSSVESALGVIVAAEASPVEMAAFMTAETTPTESGDFLAAESDPFPLSKFVAAEVDPAAIVSLASQLSIDDLGEFLAENLAPDILAELAAESATPADKAEFIAAEIPGPKIAQFAANVTPTGVFAEFLAAESDPTQIAALTTETVPRDDVLDFVAAEVSPEILAKHKGSLAVILAEEVTPSDCCAFLVNAVLAEEIATASADMIDVAMIGEFVAAETSPAMIADLLAAEVSPVDLGVFLAAETDNQTIESIARTYMDQAAIESFIFAETTANDLARIAAMTTTADTFADAFGEVDAQDLGEFIAAEVDPVVIAAFLDEASGAGKGGQPVSQELLKKVGVVDSADLLVAARRLAANAADETKSAVAALHLCRSALLSAALAKAA